MADNTKVYYGSDIKLKITLDFGEGVDMDAVDFVAIIRSGNASLELKKSQLIRVDAKNYLACVKAPNTGHGEVVVEVRAFLPDNDFEDNIHTIVTPASAGVQIV